MLEIAARQLAHDRTPLIQAAAGGSPHAIQKRLLADTAPIGRRSDKGGKDGRGAGRWADSRARNHATRDARSLPGKFDRRNRFAQPSARPLQSAVTRDNYFAAPTD